MEKLELFASIGKWKKLKAIEYSYMKAKKKQDMVTKIGRSIVAK